MNAVQMTAKMYDARDAAKTLLREAYPERMREFGELIQKVAAGKGITEVAAMTQMAKTAMDDGEQFAATFVIAAYVEMVEPSA